eukprot:TRINITY_DN3227_c0_g1_i1.p1 TRINITY_DN3227_c0_g1~~TRINITY_DN3227_c0_g1_i1.p1  ORF type:complete len:200 (+),score=23.29 TRINITY_DN3227_c0_g1_i1:953-1552(+)
MGEAAAEGLFNGASPAARNLLTNRSSSGGRAVHHGQARPQGHSHGHGPGVHGAHSTHGAHAHNLHVHAPAHAQALAHTHAHPLAHHAHGPHAHGPRAHAHGHRHAGRAASSVDESVDGVVLHPEDGDDSKDSGSGRRRQENMDGGRRKSRGDSKMMTVGEMMSLGGVAPGGVMRVAGEGVKGGKRSRRGEGMMATAMVA